MAVSPGRAWLPFILPLLAGAIVAGAVVYGMALRLPHPYDLEWMEGGQLTHAWRILHGRPLYPEPGPDWIPYIYPPGQPAIVAGLGGLFGLSLPLGRAVSWFGTALAAGSLVALVVRQGVGPARWPAGIVAAMLYLSCWWPGGAFFDLVRPDALALGLLLLATALALERRPGLQIAGGLLLALAFVVKHNMAAFGPAIALGLLARDGWRSGLRFGVAAAVPAGLTAVALHLATGTFLTYLLVVPASHGTVGLRIVPGTPWELGDALPAAGLLATGAALLAVTETLSGRTRWIVRISALILSAGVGGIGLLLPAGGVRATTGGAFAGMAAVALGLVVLGIASVVRVRGGTLPRGFALTSGIGLTALVVAAWMRGHHGGFVNVYLPLFAAVSLGAGLALTWLARRPVLAWLAGGLIAAQLLLAWWQLPLDRLVPTGADRVAGEQVVEALREVDGPVWSPISPWLPVLAGHEPGPHLIAVWDVANHRDGPWPRSRQQLTAAVKAHHWGAIVQGSDPVEFGVKEAYVQQRRFRLGAGLRPKTGWGNRPSSLWVPAPSRGGGTDEAAPPR